VSDLRRSTARAEGICFAPPTAPDRFHAHGHIGERPRSAFPPPLAFTWNAALLWVAHAGIVSHSPTRSPNPLCVLCRGAGDILLCAEARDPAAILSALVRVLAGQTCRSQCILRSVGTRVGIGISSGHLVRCCAFGRSPEILSPLHCLRSLATRVEITAGFGAVPRERRVRKNWSRERGSSSEGGTVEIGKKPAVLPEGIRCVGWWYSGFEKGAVQRTGP